MRFRPCTTHVTVGQRVAIHPSTDAWMMGDRYGTVHVIGSKHVHVMCDSGTLRRFHPSNVTPSY